MPPVPQPQGHPGGQTVWNKRKTLVLPLYPGFLLTMHGLQSRWEL